MRLLQHRIFVFSWSHALDTFELLIEVRQSLIATFMRYLGNAHHVLDEH